MGARPVEIEPIQRDKLSRPAELVQHHTEGWPQDFFRQLAVALDVPLARLEVPLGVGGPLFVAAALRLTPGQAVRHLR